MHPRSRPLASDTKPSAKALEQFHKFTIQHVGSELLKVIQVMSPDGGIISHNNLDIPHGLFGLSLKKFRERRHMDIVYIDIMQLVRKEVMERVKDYIVMIELHSLIRTLFTSFHRNRIEKGLQEVRDAARLLNIGDEIYAEYVFQAKQLRRSEEALFNFNSEANKKLQEADSKIMDALNQLKTIGKIWHPIEYRYEVNFSWSFADCKLNLQMEEQEYRQQIDRKNYLRDREYMCSSSICMKLTAEIRDYKRRIQLMERKLARDMEDLQSKHDYIKNSSLMQVSRLNDCKMKLEFFHEDKPRLIAWLMEREAERREKQRAEFLKLILNKKGKSKRRGRRSRREE